MFLQKYYQISVQGIVVSQRIKTILQLMVSGKVEAGIIYWMPRCSEGIVKNSAVLKYTNVKVHS